MTMPFDPQFQLTLSCGDTGWTMAVAGELDLASADALPDLARELAHQQPEAVALDLSGVSFIDSAGCSGLVAAVGALEEEGVPTEVVRVSPAVARFFALIRRLDLGARGRSIAHLVALCSRDSLRLA